MRKPLVLAIILLGSATSAYAAAASVSAETLIDAIEARFPIPPGARRAHLKPGLCVAGTFTGTRAARRLSRAALFWGKPIPSTGRLGLAGSNIHASDRANIPRGLALAFALPDGKRMNMAMISVPVFAVATPEAFRDQLDASRPDPATGKPDPARMAAFAARHPDTAPLKAWQATHGPTAGYTETAFYSVHAFHFISSASRDTVVRWRFVPADGVRELADGQGSDNFLNGDFERRLTRGPVKWDMIVTIAGAGDPENDPTALWPADRREVRAGTLTLTAATPQKGGACDGESYSPLVLPDGIAPGNDPVLKIRGPVYRLSHARRMAGQ